jgi:hypothetical protein
VAVRLDNVHERSFPVAPEAAGSLLEGLSGRPDPLWPEGPWPPMRLDRPLGVGADGGHGPIRYRVEQYEPGSRITFRFTGPPGLTGTHEWRVAAAPDGCLLRHAVAGRATGVMLLAWPLVYRPLHDALIEDALDKAEQALTGGVARPRSWSWWVRLLRRRAVRRA